MYIGFVIASPGDDWKLGYENEYHKREVKQFMEVFELEEKFWECGG